MQNVPTQKHSTIYSYKRNNFGMSFNWILYKCVYYVTLSNENIHHMWVHPMYEMSEVFLNWQGYSTYINIMLPPHVAPPNVWNERSVLALPKTHQSLEKVTNVSMVWHWWGILQQVMNFLPWMLLWSCVVCKERKVKR